MSHETDDGRTLVPYEDIASFYDEGWIAEVLFPVKSGKEATVYCCRGNRDRHGGGHHYLALKLYKQLTRRSFHNDNVYRESVQRQGHIRPETRHDRALRKRTRFGREVQLGSWVGREHAMLARLHAAGVSVPQPITAGGSGLLLEFIGEDGEPAPLLRNVRLTVVEAEPLFRQAIRDVERMLACHVVHGDLSSYNILVHRGRLVVIDLPQAVDARTNPSARQLLARDVGNLCRYFVRAGVTADAEAIAEELWQRYVNAEL